MYAELMKENLKDVKKIFLILLVVFILLSFLSGFFLKGKEDQISLLLSTIFQEKGLLPPGEQQLNPGQLLPPSEAGIDFGEYLTVGGIFKNNIRAAGGSIVLGFIPFLFLPLISLLLNGVIIGGVYPIFMMIPGMSLLSFLVSILPHGIIEIPALVLAIALGVLLCRDLTRKILRKEILPLGYRLKGIIMIFVFMILPALLVASFLEAYVTPYLINLLM